MLTSTNEREIEMKCPHCDEGVKFRQDFESPLCEVCNGTGELLPADWSEPYLKLEQSHKSLKDALNQERYEDAEELLILIAAYTGELFRTVSDKLE